MLTLLSCCISSCYAPIDGLPQDGGGAGGGGGGNPGEILTFQVFKCQFPYHKVSIRSQIVLLQKISIPLPWKVFFLYWNLNLNLKTT